MCVFLESFWSKYDDNDVLGFGGLFSLEDNRVVKLQSPWFMVLSFLFFFFVVFSFFFSTSCFTLVLVITFWAVTCKQLSISPLHWWQFKSFLLFCFVFLSLLVFTNGFVGTFVSNHTKRRNECKEILIQENCLDVRTELAQLS